MLHFKVDQESAGQRPDRAIRRMAPGVDRAEAMRLLRAGRILVNDRPSSLRTVLQAGDEVRVREISPAPPVATRPNRGATLPGGGAILFRDHHLLVVDKPAGMASHGAPGVPEGSSAVERAAEYLAVQGVTTARPPAAAGRLHRGTSGVLILTLSVEAEKGMARQFEEGAVRKVYVALCHGVCQPTFHVDEPVVVTRYRPGQSKQKKTRDARTAFTRLATGNGASLVEARPETGRMHQVRKHLRAAGHPIVGDGRHGLRQDRGAEAFFLHCMHVECVHPATLQPLVLEAPVPRTFLEACTAHGIAWSKGRS